MLAYQCRELGHKVVDPLVCHRDGQSCFGTVLSSVILVTMAATEQALIYKGPEFDNSQFYGQSIQYAE